MVASREAELAAKKADVDQERKQLMAEQAEIAQHNEKAHVFFTRACQSGACPNSQDMMMLILIVIRSDVGDEGDCYHGDGGDDEHGNTYVCKQASQCSADQDAEEAGLAADERDLEEQRSQVEEMTTEANSLLQATLAVIGGVTPAAGADDSGESSRKRKGSGGASSSAAP